MINVIPAWLSHWPMDIPAITRVFASTLLTFTWHTYVGHGRPR